MAVLRNLRLMRALGVEHQLIRERLDKGVTRALLFRFATAARYAPGSRTRSRRRCSQRSPDLAKLLGSTLRIDGPVDFRGRVRHLRMDAAAGLATLLRQKANKFFGIFSNESLEVPRRGFALRDAIVNSQPHSATYFETGV